MADCVLSNGKEVIFDLRKIKVSEYRAMFDDSSVFEDDEAAMARCAGLTLDEIHELTLYDNKLLWQEFFRVCKEPLRDIQDPKA